MFEIEGQYTTATVHTTRDNVDESTINQIQEMINHEAFRNRVEIMADTHYGAGAVIGFTMPLGERICPNSIGVDIGCGMTAFRLDDPYLPLDDTDEMRRLDEEIRRHVPMGRSTFADVPVDQDYHIVDDFPWRVCESKLNALNRNWSGGPIESPDYGKEYFMDLCERVGYDVGRAIFSIGTLGGGNHFVEISRCERDGNYWVVVHSGSRGIGLSTAEYWQEQAHLACDDRAEEIRNRLADIPDFAYKFDLDEVSSQDLLDWVRGGMGEDWKDPEAIRQRRDGEAIGELIDRLKDIGRYASENADGDPLDYLEGEEAHGYLRDMVFCQTYAEESRRKMCQAVADVLDAGVAGNINSTHNYIDFGDAIIRKGATRVRSGELGIIPFNMRDGSIIVRGKGNDDWNQSAPHGAGRRGSRRWAFEEFDLAEFSREMEGIFSTSVTEDTLDEAPMAYKDRNVVLERIEETAEVVDELTPVMNLKADE